MEKFDFISGEDFRKSLEGDYNELVECLKVNAWKAAHVLAGSIIETLLIDILIASNYKHKTGGDPLKMDLGQAIAVCKKEGILSEKAEQLSSAIKSYRNLIHPGRKIRLEEEVDENGAKVAQALVDIVIKEVSAKRKENYGYTAEQIVSKLERDSSALSIIEHILKETNPVELERLLIVAIPKRYNELKTDEFVQQFVWSSLEHCFRTAFNIVSEELKKKVMKRFISVLKEADEEIVLSYETAFFRGSDLKYLSRTDAKLVKEHLLSRLSKDCATPLLQALKDIGKCLTLDDMPNFIDPLIRAIVYGKNDKLKIAVTNFIIDEYSNMKKNVKDRVFLRLDDWIPFIEKKKMAVQAESLRDIKSTLEF